MFKFMKGKSFNFVSRDVLDLTLNQKFIKNQVGRRNFYAVVEYLYEQ